MATVVYKDFCEYLAPAEYRDKMTIDATMYDILPDIATSQSKIDYATLFVDNDSPVFGIIGTSSGDIVCSDTYDGATGKRRWDKWFSFVPTDTTRHILFGRVDGTSVKVWDLPYGDLQNNHPSYPRYSGTHAEFPNILSQRFKYSKNKKLKNVTLSNYSHSAIDIYSNYEVRTKVDTNGTYKIAGGVTYQYGQDGIIGFIPHSVIPPISGSAAGTLTVPEIQSSDTTIYHSNSFDTPSKVVTKDATNYNYGGSLYGNFWKSSKTLTKYSGEILNPGLFMATYADGSDTKYVFHPRETTYSPEIALNYCNGLPLYGLEYYINSPLILNNITETTDVDGNLCINRYWICVISFINFTNECRKSYTHIIRAGDIHHSENTNLIGKLVVWRDGVGRIYKDYTSAPQAGWIHNELPIDCLGVSLHGLQGSTGSGYTTFTDIPVISGGYLSFTGLQEGQQISPGDFNTGYDLKKYDPLNAASYNNVINEGGYIAFPSRGMVYSAMDSYSNQYSGFRNETCKVYQLQYNKTTQEGAKVLLGSVGMTRHEVTNATNQDFYYTADVSTITNALEKGWISHLLIIEFDYEIQYIGTGGPFWEARKVFAKNLDLGNAGTLPPPHIASKGDIHSFHSWVPQTTGTLIFNELGSSTCTMTVDATSPISGNPDISQFDQQFKLRVASDYNKQIASGSDAWGQYMASDGTGFSPYRFELAVVDSQGRYIVEPLGSSTTKYWAVQPYWQVTNSVKFGATKNRMKLQDVSGNDYIDYFPSLPRPMKVGESLTVILRCATDYYPTSLPFLGYAWRKSVYTYHKWRITPDYTTDGNGVNHLTGHCTITAI